MQWSTSRPARNSSQSFVAFPSSFSLTPSNTILSSFTSGIPFSNLASTKSFTDFITARPIPSTTSNRMMVSWGLIFSRSFQKPRYQGRKKEAPISRSFASTKSARGETFASKSFEGWRLRPSNRTKAGLGSAVCVMLSHSNTSSQLLGES